MEPFCKRNHRVEIGCATCMRELAAVVREFREHETHTKDKYIDLKEHVLKRFEIMNRMYAIVDSI